MNKFNILSCDGKTKDFIFKNPGHKVDKIFYTYHGVDHFFDISGKNIHGRHVVSGSFPENGQKCRVVLSVCPDKDTSFYHKKNIVFENEEVFLSSQQSISGDEKMNQKSFVTHAEKAFDSFYDELVKPISEKLEEESKRHSEHYKGLSDAINKLKETQNNTAKYLEENLVKGSIEECRKQIGEMQKSNDILIEKLKKEIFAVVEERVKFTDDLIEKFIMISARIETKFKQLNKE